MLKKNAIENRIIEIIYLVFLGIYAGIAFSASTTFFIRWNPTFLLVTRILLICFTFYKILREDRWKVHEVVLVFLIGVSLMLSYYLNGWTYMGDSALIFELVLLVIAARGLDGDRIIKVYMCVILALLLVTAFAALTGHINNYVYTKASHDYKPRMSYGTVYPTDFAAHIMSLVLCYLWTRKERKPWQAIIPFTMAVFCLVFCDTRLTSLCLLLLAVGALIPAGILTGLGDRIPESVKKVTSGIAVYSVPVMAFIMLLISRFYSDSNPVLRIINGALNNRLYYGRMGFENYDTTLFGQRVIQIGSGGFASVGKEYFFIDCSYESVLLRYGVFVLIALLAAYTYIAFTEKKKGNYFRLFLIVVMAILFSIEHHMPELGYMPFILLMLSANSTNKDSKTGEVSE